MGSLIHSFSLLPGCAFRFVWFFWLLLRQFFAPKWIIALIMLTLILKTMTRHINNRFSKEKNQSLTAGGLLVAQKGSRPVLAQTCFGSFSILCTASVISSPESWSLECRSGSSTRPEYSHIKPEHRLRGSMLHDIQQRARSTPVKPLAIKALSFDS